MITLKWLEENFACKPALKEWEARGLQELSLQAAIKILRVDKNFIYKRYELYSLEWCAWLLSYYLPKKDKVKLAVYAAELVLPIFEEKYQDWRPRDILVLIKSNDYCITDEAYTAAARAVQAVACAAYTAYAAAYKTAQAVTYGGWTAYDASRSAYAAAYAASQAAYNAAIANVTEEETFNKIIDFGLNLIARGGPSFVQH